MYELSLRVGWFDVSLGIVGSCPLSCLFSIIAVVVIDVEDGSFSVGGDSIASGDADV